MKTSTRKKNGLKPPLQFISPKTIQDALTPSTSELDLILISDQKTGQKKTVRFIITGLISSFSALAIGLRFADLFPPAPILGLGLCVFLGGITIGVGTTLAVIASKKNSTLLKSKTLLKK